MPMLGTGNIMLIKNTLRLGSQLPPYFRWMSHSEKLAATTTSLNRGNYQQRRNFDLQEYQSKQILHEHGVQVQRFKVVSNVDQARQVLYPDEYQQDRISSGGSSSKEQQQQQQQPSRWLGFNSDISQSEEFVIKAQIMAGGRGRGTFRNTGLNGGVQLTQDRDEAIRLTQLMLNDYLVTKQTKSGGVLVDKVMIAEAVRLKKEFYLAMVLDRSYDSGPILIASHRGGMDIEEVAAKEPFAIRRFTIPIDMEVEFDTARRIAVAAFELDVQRLDIVDQCAREIIKLHKMFLELDATQVEINPLGVTKGNQVVCVDAKINFDENARFRHKWMDEVEQMNEHEEDERDIAARKHQLNFIGLDGTIGCLVNGAGLAMATMDIIKLHGGEPANFLDVGGGASANQVTEAFKIITSDAKVKTIFVNIFGGIMRCDVIAEGIIQAAQEVKSSGVPIVCRLQGTKVREAQELIKSSGLAIQVMDDLDEAAKKAVAMAV